MKKIICKDYAEMSEQAAVIIATQIKNKPESVLGLPTGSTPIGTYNILRKMYDEGEVDFSKVMTFNLDEYYPLARDNSQSYHYYMKENLFGHVNILPDNVNIPNGEAEDPTQECVAYEEKLADVGGTDLQVLGIGRNGHIGFNEPDGELPLATRLVDLTPDTIDANARFFDNEEDVPKQALTMGVGGIFNSKHIVLLISGEGKAEITKELFSGEVSTQNPASLLNLHNNVTVIMDEEAASML
jgi:glucosamine-6-phosphate deaminase